MKQTKPIIWGIFATLGIITFYISVLSLFAGSSFAFSEFGRLWPWLVTLAIGFGIQIGLFISIRNDVCLKKNVATSGAISGTSMVICCSHFILNLIPILGLSALAGFLMTYQKLFFALGIASSIFGIIMVLNHKKKMKGGKF